MFESRERLALYAFVFCGTVLVLSLAFAAGLYSGFHRNAVFKAIQGVKNQIELGAAEVVSEPFADLLYAAVDEDEPPLSILRPDAVEPGLVLLMGVEAGPRNFVRVIDRQGQVVHAWHPDWFEMWEDAEDRFPEERNPVSGVGTLLHGIELTDGGDIVFNFEHLSTVRMNPCGEVLWKLDNLGHHSVHEAEDGTFWVSAETLYDTYPPFYLNQTESLRAWTAQNISADGEILREIDMVEVLTRNDLLGLLRMSSLSNQNPLVSGDTLHLNDVETFPSSFDSEVFEPGDIMVSLRNINTVFVMDPETFEIKFRTTGRVLRQHDPDFMPGDRISIFDNRNIGRVAGEDTRASRIVEVDARTGEFSPAVPPRDEAHFFTGIMGVHERLPNGNVLIVSAGEGRILELTEDGRLAWEYHNRIEEGRNGRVTGAMVLPLEMDEAFFAERAAECS